MNLVLIFASPKMARLFIERIDRNVPFGLEPLAHAIFRAKRFDLLNVLLEFKDVDWDAADGAGLTVLGLFVHCPDEALDEQFQNFVRKTPGFYLCYNNSRLQHSRCILVESLRLYQQLGLLSLKRYNFFIQTRTEDSFAAIMVSAAGLLRIDLFEELVRMRVHCFHELNVVFDALLSFLKLDEPIYLEYLHLIMEIAQKSKQHNFKDIFIFKWKCQLAPYQ
jgi:hypothetical protein